MKGKREDLPGQKGKGKGPAPGFEPDFHSTTRPRARTHERTKRNETISRLDTPPNLRYTYFLSRRTTPIWGIHKIQ